MSDTKQLFVTNPHGAQEVILLEASEVEVAGYKKMKPANCLFEIREMLVDPEVDPKDVEEKADRIVMTGLEIDSLCKWWLEYKRA